MGFIVISAILLWFFAPKIKSALSGRFISQPKAHQQLNLIEQSKTYIPPELVKPESKLIETDKLASTKTENLVDTNDWSTWTHGEMYDTPTFLRKRIAFPTTSKKEKGKRYAEPNKLAKQGFDSFCKFMESTQAQIRHQQLKLQLSLQRDAELAN